METTISAGDFKAKCLRLLDVVAEQRESLAITKRGKPIARLMPMQAEVNLFGAMAGSVPFDSAIVAPIDVEWEACK